jgi:hypothetical protein
MGVYCIYTYEDSTMKPTKHCLKGRKRERGIGIRWRGGTCSRYTVHMHGIITMKFPCIIVYDKPKKINFLKKKIKSSKKKERKKEKVKDHRGQL